MIHENRVIACHFSIYSIGEISDNTEHTFGVTNSMSIIYFGYSIETECVIAMNRLKWNQTINFHVLSSADMNLLARFSCNAFWNAIQRIKSNLI